MKRILLLLTVAALLLALTAGVALAQATQNPHNCYGAAQSEFVAGAGGNPGTTNGQVTSSFAKKQQVDEFQQGARESNANCGESTPD